jgi:TetR/AcrR family transcriptional regulator, transcriptional repressor of bet genes
MGRPSNRDQKRREILEAFARVMADHGYAGATIAAIAHEARIAPGLVHHHFDDKSELLRGLVHDLVSKFRQRVHHYEGKADPLLAYIDGALKLDERADLVAAKCWVGVFAEAVRNPTLFAQMRTLLDTEVSSIEHRSRGRLSSQEAGAVLAFIIGALVLGAFAPRKTAGFAAPGLRKLIAAFGVRAEEGHESSAS